MSYNLLIQTLKQTFESDDLVSTVITGDATEVDNYRKNLFPLVHIDVESFAPVSNIDNTSTVDYSVIITVVDIRDVNKEEDRDKFWKNDNRHDNWNKTAFILRTGLLKMVKEIYGDNVSLLSNSTAELLSFTRENTLDGWQQTWVVSVPDIYVKACDE